jgi:hypothetical protein
MHDNEYENSFDEFQIKKRIKYAVNNGVNTCILTGTGEALQNRNFLIKLATIFKELDHPFPNVELQTTGVFLNKQTFGQVTHSDYPNINLLKDLGVNTISLSISDIFNDKSNMDFIGTPKHLQFKLAEIIKLLKEHKFNVRASLNMTNIYDAFYVDQIFERLKELKVDQITFRELYTSGKDLVEDQWIDANKCKPNTIRRIEDEIHHLGRTLYQLPYGPVAFSIHGMSTVLDDDCMSKENNKSLKYVILRENGKLYCQWDDEGSLIF